MDLKGGVQLLDEEVGKVQQTSEWANGNFELLQGLRGGNQPIENGGIIIPWEKRDADIQISEREQVDGSWLRVHEEFHDVKAADRKLYNPAGG